MEVGESRERAERVAAGVLATGARRARGSEAPSAGAAFPGQDKDEVARGGGRAPSWVHRCSLLVIGLGTDEMKVSCIFYAKMMANEVATAGQGRIKEKKERLGPD